MSPFHCRRFALVLAVFALVGAARTPLAGQADALLDLSEWRAPRGQTCSVQSLDTDVHPFAIVDTARLNAVAHSSAAEGSVLLSISTDTLGRTMEVRTIESTLPETVTRVLVDSLQAAFVGNPAAKSLIARLRVDLAAGQSARLRLGASQICGPVLRNGAQVRQIIARRAEGAGGTAVLRMYVAEDGTVRRAEVRTSSGSISVDRAAVEAAAHMRFLPALVNRMPVTMLTELPVHIPSSR